MSTSFPFLKIARDFSVPYGDVIRCAEAWNCKRAMDKQELASFRLFKGNEALTDAIIAAVEAELDRRFAVARTQCA